MGTAAGPGDTEKWLLRAGFGALYSPSFVKILPNVF